MTGFGFTLFEIDFLTGLKVLVSGDNDLLTGLSVLVSEDKLVASLVLFRGRKKGFRLGTLFVGMSSAGFLSSIDCFCLLGGGVLVYVERRSSSLASASSCDTAFAFSESSSMSICSIASCLCRRRR